MAKKIIKSIKKAPKKTTKRASKAKVEQKTVVSNSWGPITEANKKYITEHYLTMGVDMLSVHTGLPVDQINDFVLNVDRDNPNVNKPQLRGPVNSGLTHKNATVMTPGHSMRGDRHAKDIASNKTPLEGVVPIEMKGENQTH